MENVSSVSRHFVLLGLVEMEDLRYLYCILSLFLYIFILLLSLGIVLVVLTEESLHEPMYIFICNLTFNGMLGSSSFFPKLIIDLLTSSHQISHVGCFLQLLGLITYAIFEISSFTLMAYDRYLAVCDPLRYATNMTNAKAARLIVGFFAFSFFSVLVTVILSARLSYCGTQIKNIFCENLSLIVLSCGDSSVNSLYGILSTVIFLVFTLLIIAYSYINIFMVCLRISKEACEKAIHTVVTHFLSFSIFLVGGLFIFLCSLEYKLESGIKTTEKQNDPYLYLPTAEMRCRAISKRRNWKEINVQTTSGRYRTDARFSVDYNSSFEETPAAQRP
eukprot:XP_004912484.2 PREDICTED: olfactory receptor 8U1-like [Xenopus tropicalis]